MTTRGSLLIVDDDVSIADLLTEYLSEQGYEVAVATNGGEALMLTALKRPDAIILDLQLPDVSGAELLGKLRARDDSIAVVMLSGTDDDDLSRALVKAGALDYVRKPFKLAALDAAVNVAVAVGQLRPREDTMLPVGAGLEPALLRPAAR